jgi:hypothetical protein
MKIQELIDILQAFLNAGISQPDDYVDVHVIGKNNVFRINGIEISLDGLISMKVVPTDVIRDE